MIKLEKVTTDIQRGMIKNVIKKHHSYVPTADYPGRRIDWLIYDVIDDETWPFKRELLGMIGIGSFSSLQAFGKSSFFWISFTVINPARLPFLSTTKRYIKICWYV